MTARTFFQKGNSGDPLVFPLTSIPIDDGNSRLVNPKVGTNDYDLVEPTYPGEEGFEDELFEVLRVRHDVGRGVWPAWFFQRYGVDATPTPVILPHVTDDDGMIDPELAAGLVEMDEPTKLADELIEALREAGAEPVASNEDHVDFQSTHVEIHEHVGAVISEAAEAFFGAKSWFGRPRPEEVLGFNCTSYENGCPCHGAYPAGHGTFAGAIAAILIAYYGLEPGSALWNLVIQTAAQWAMFRTLAGVHYADDNIVGFLLGFRVALDYVEANPEDFSLAA